jgi:hypothetical protein
MNIDLTANCNASLGMPLRSRNIPMICYKDQYSEKSDGECRIGQGPMTGDAVRFGTLAIVLAAFWETIREAENSKLLYPLASYVRMPALVAAAWKGAASVPSFMP